jgi:hypothetical protein
VRAQEAAAERRRERQEARRREEEEFDSRDGRDMARFLDSQASQAVGQRGVQIVLVRSGLRPAPPSKSAASMKLEGAKWHIAIS